MAMAQRKKNERTAVAQKKRREHGGAESNSSPRPARPRPNLRLTLPAAHVFLFATRRKYEYPKQTPPSFYQVTNSSKERPDVWVESPEKSIIVSITSDIRTIRSEVFAAPYSLRFPRIDRVRYDKPWHECLDVQIDELMNSLILTTVTSILMILNRKSLDQKVLLELAMRILKLEVSMGGGKVSDDLFHATHLVIISLPEFCVDFDTLLRSESDSMIEDHMRKHVIPSSTAKNVGTEKEVALEESTVNMLLPKRDGKRKQRASGRSTSRGKATIIKRPRRTKFGSKPARIDENESSESDAIRMHESDSMIEDHMRKHVIPSSTAKNVGTEKEVALEESTVNMLLPKRDGKRKQRASGRSTSRGKATIIKRPRRTKFGSKPARIDENESSESDAIRMQ
nr:DNA ligase 4 isoform X2 [Ipomoea batatas]